MNPHVRIVFKEHPGYPESPGVAFNYNALAAWEKATSRPDGIRNLRLYGKSAASNSDGGLQPAAGLDYYVIYEQAYNNVGVSSPAWTASLISSARHFEELPRPFRANVPGLHYLFAGDAPARFTSTFSLAKDKAVSLRFHLLRPKTGARHIVGWQIGLPGAGIRLEIIEGRFRVCRLSAAWSQSEQSNLDALRNGSGTISGATQASINAIQDVIYLEITDVDLGIDAENIYGRDIELHLIPEKRGRLHIIAPGATDYTVDIKDILDTRLPGTVWNAAPLVFSVNRGACFWQIGTVYFLESGSIKLPPYRWFYINPLSVLDVVHNGQSDISHPDSAIDVDFDEANPLWPRIYATLSGDGTGTPFFYSFGSFAAAGERTGGDTLFLDTEEWNESKGISKFIPSCEGENKRVKLLVTLDNRDNFLELPLLGRELADRLCDVYADDEKWLGNLLCSKAAVSPVGIENGAFVATGETRIDLEFVDMETQGEFDLMIDDPVLDGLVLGDALWIVLRGQGWTDAELAGIDRTMGPTLESAALGEAPAVRPERETPRAGFVDFLMEKYGFNYELDSFSGVWTLREVGSLPAIALDESIACELELTRDNSEVKNVFPFEGLGGLCALWIIDESFRAPDWAGYMGRMARMATTKDDGRRTVSSVTSGAHSTARQGGKPGDFAAFQYDFDWRLLPRRRFYFSTIPDKVFEVERIEPADWTMDEMMAVSAREVVAIP